MDGQVAGTAGENSQFRLFIMESHLSVICIAAMLASFSCANIAVLLDESEIFVNVKNIFVCF